MPPWTRSALDAPAVVAGPARRGNRRATASPRDRGPITFEGNRHPGAGVPDDLPPGTEPEQVLAGLRDRLDGRIRVLPSTAGLHFSFRVLAPVDWNRAMARAVEGGLAFDACSRFAIRGRDDRCCAIGFGLLRDDRVPEVVDRLAKAFG